MTGSIQVVVHPFARVIQLKDNAMKKAYLEETITLYSVHFVIHDDKQYQAIVVNIVWCSISDNIVFKFDNSKTDVIVNNDVL